MSTSTSTSPRGGPPRSRRRRVALAAVLTLVAGTGGALLQSGSASAAVAAAPSGIDRVVSLSGTIDGTCGSGISGGTPVYTTIQAAVSAASGGQQIYVCAGTYTENIDVATSNIDILGPNWNDPTGASDEARIVAASGSSPVINFASTSGTDNGVRGLTLEGGTYGVRAQSTSGCCWDDASTEGIRNNVIVDSTVAGIETNGLDSGLIAGNTITPAANGDGIRTYDATGGLNLESNTITLSGTGVGITFGGAGEQCCQWIGSDSGPSAGNTITGGQTGILFLDTTPTGTIVDTNRIRYNTLSGMSGDAIRYEGPIQSSDIRDNVISDVGGSGLYVENTSTANRTDNYTIERNTITNAGRDGVTILGRANNIRIGSNGNGNTIVNPGRHGVAVIGVVQTAGAPGTRDFAMDGMQIRGNTISGSGDSAIYVEQADDVPIENNTITGSGNHGIEGLTFDQINARNNSITGSAGDGIFLDDVYDSDVADNTIADNVGDGIELTGGSGSVYVFSNDVNGNENGIRVTGATVAAPNVISSNDVSLNFNYGCEDQTSGTQTNPPAVGTQGNDWDPNNTGAALQAPEAICGATLTAAGPLDDGIVGVAYAETMNVSGAPGPYTWYSSGLPAGLTLDPATGEVSGTPTTPVTNREVTFWVRSEGGLWGQFRDPITVTNALTASASLPDGTVNQPYTSPSPTTSNGTGPFTWSATGLPAGLSIDPATGVVSGTPTAAVAGQTVDFTVTDSLGEQATTSATITVLPDDPGVPLANPAVAAGVLVLGFGVAFATRRRRYAMT